MSIDNHLNDRLEELRIWKTSVATDKSNFILKDANRRDYTELFLLRIFIPN